MNHLELIHLLEPNFLRVEEAPFELSHKTVGWTSVFLDQSDRALGGGVHSDRETSRQIALSETVERALFKKIYSLGDAQQLDLENHPSSCGFAVGFDKDNTKQRSINEALERWAISQWLDFGYALSEVYSDTTSGLSQYFIEPFDKVAFYHKDFASLLPDGPHLVVALGFKNGGVFLGSRVASDLNHCYEHALSELWRHFSNFNNIDDAKKAEVIRGRIYHFGVHGEEGLQVIRNASKLDWPTPKLHLCKEIKVPYPGVYMYRTLFSDYKGWHLGGTTRFIY